MTWETHLKRRVEVFGLKFCLLFFFATTQAVNANDDPPQSYSARTYSAPNLRSEVKPNNLIRTEAEVGPEVFYSRYDERDIRHYQGLNFGLFGNYSIRYLNLYMFEFDGDLSYGQASGDSEFLGPDEDETNWQYELRGLVGLDFPIRVNLPLEQRKWNVTPYLGGAWRYVMNDAGGNLRPGSVPNFRTEMSYFYIPAGIDYMYRLDSHWKMNLRLEYDFFASGEVTDHLEDFGTGLDKTVMDQGSGFGLRGSVKFSRKVKDCDLFIEPFAHFWDIEQSELVGINSNGNLVIISETPTEIVFLADLTNPNHTMEFGLRLGVSF